MSRIAPLSEKVLATEAAFTALMSEIDTRVDRNDARVQVAIINAAVTLAMATDTRDLGILAPVVKPCDHRYRVNAVTSLGCTLQLGHAGEHVWEDELAGQ